MVGQDLYPRPCFAAGTPVLVSHDGQAVPVEQLREGDFVLSGDEHEPAGELALQRVEEVFVRFGRIFHVHVRGRVLRTTAEHPFWVRGKAAWVPAGELAVGDELRGHDGQWVAVEDMCDTGAYEVVYNCRVAQWHTYFVGCQEWVRALPSDLDLAGGVITVREKKRDKRKLTTRRVPLTPLLKEVLTAWLSERTGGPTLFCKEGGRPISPREAHNYFRRGLRLSPWAVLKGWHVFRHSFISALASKGVDQRIIDDLVGHSTDEQRRRYRHLFPDVKQQALAGVFG